MSKKRRNEYPAARELVCGNKVRYNSFTDAEHALKIIRRYGQTSQHMGKYHCRYCSGWHLGHSKH